MSNTKCVTEVKVRLKHENLREVQKWRAKKQPVENVLAVLHHSQAFQDGDGNWTIKPVFTFLTQEAYHKDPEKGSNFESMKFLYESHQCPTNFMRHGKKFTIRDSDHETDYDPHGLWTFVGWISVERLKELTGKTVRVDEFCLPQEPKATQQNEEIDWHSIAEQVWSDFRPDLDDDNIEANAALEEELSRPVLATVHAKPVEAPPVVLRKDLMDTVHPPTPAEQVFVAESIQNALKYKTKLPAAVKEIIENCRYLNGSIHIKIDVLNHVGPFGQKVPFKIDLELGKTGPIFHTQIAVPNDKKDDKEHIQNVTSYINHIITEIQL